MRIRSKQTNCVCVVCGALFIALSSKAKTCTEVCRKRLSRQHQRLLDPARPYNGNSPANHARATMFRGRRRPGYEAQALPASPVAIFLQRAIPNPALRELTA